MEFLAKAPPPPAAVVPEERDLTKVRCLITKSYIPILACKWGFSGHVNYLIAASPEGLSQFPKHVHIVCPKCKILTLLLPPHRDPHGFVLETGKCYHVEHCPRCRPGTSKAPIIEKLVFYRARGIPYDVDRSLAL